MAATLGTLGFVRSTETFDSLNPASGEVVGTYPVYNEQDVAETVDRARAAAQWWADLGWTGRRQRLLAWKSYLTRYIGRLAELVHNETGKPIADAQLEILLAIVHVDWAAKHARRVLRSRRVRSGLIAINQAATLEYQPLGVVGVIGPWNYPVFTPMGSIAYALAAGNAVVFKPSEFTPAVGGWLVSSFAEVVPEQPVLQLVTGMGRDRAATWPAATSTRSRSRFEPRPRRRSWRRAPRISPPWSRSAAARTPSSWPPTPTWTRPPTRCLGRAVQRRPDLHRRRARLRRAGRVPHVLGEADRSRRASCGPATTARPTIGPMTMPSQVEVVGRHIADAMARGGRAGDRRHRQHPPPIRRPGDPGRRAGGEHGGHRRDVRADHHVAKVANLDEAVERANASRTASAAPCTAGSKKARNGGGPRAARAG